MVEKENSLGEDDTLDFLCIISRDKAVMDTYIGFSNPDLRIRFVDRVLQNARL